MRGGTRGLRPEEGRPEQGGCVTRMAPGVPPAPPSSVAYEGPLSLADVASICRDARELLDRRGQGNRAFAVELLLREFLNNAIVHGNAEDPRKTVRGKVRVGTRWIVLEIADEGKGFDHRAMRRRPPDVAATSGRGLAIGKAYAERMRFNRRGNRVTLWVTKT